MPPGVPPYHYPDEGDRVTLALMEQRGIPRSEWERQEEAVLGRIDRVLLRYRHGTALDYGSGYGRLARRYAGIFRRVTSYEPDAERAGQQRELVAGSTGADRIAVVSDLGDAGTGYDAVICSHVIQHVASPTARSILRDIADRMRPTGHLLLVTTLSPGSSDRFVVSRLADNGDVVEDSVSRDRFDSAFQTGTQGLLPVRFFAFDDLRATLAELGMDLAAAYGFHGDAGVVGPLQAATADLLRCRDIAVLAQLRE
jgi:SAM-dependent methyltransferase